MGFFDFAAKLGTPSPKEKRSVVPAALPVKAAQSVVHNSQKMSVAHNTPVTEKTFEGLPAKTRTLAMEKLTFLRLVQTRKQSSPCTDKEACDYVAMNYCHQFPLLRSGGKKGESALNYSNYRNFKSKIKGITDQDQILLALCDNYARGMRPRKGDSRFWQLFYANYLNLNRLPVTVAYDNACSRLRKEDKTVVVPSMAQVRYQVDHLDPDKVILARYGEEAYKNQCCDFIRRDWSQVSPGECVIGDNRPFDTRVRKWDNGKQIWVPVRPTIAALMDARSWYMVSYWITAEPVNSSTLIDTMRLYLHATDGVPPAVVYFDNGKDYCAQGFATDLEVEGGYKHSIFRELGIKLLNSLAYNARAKTIERAFRDMMQQFDKFFPDYLGSCPGQRTMAADYYEKHPEELPSLQQFCEIFASWLTKYHNTPKNGEIHRGKSPAELWERRPRSERPALTPAQLYQAFFRPEAVRTVGRGPSVKWNNTFYYNEDLVWGTKVLVKSDTLDSEHILCCKLDGSVIGEARTRSAIHALAGSSEEVKAMMQRQRKQLKEAQTAIADLSGNLHIYSPLELLMGSDLDEKALPSGSVRKVKGPAHHYEHHQIAGVIRKEEPLPVHKEELDFSAEELAAIDFKPKREAQPDQEDLTDVYNFIHKKQGEEDNVEF